MTESATRLPPAWVYKRDGRLVPFEADKISRALFSATERLGAPDAFLARELTDGVVHFLSGEFDGVTPSTSQIAESVVKIVRELGQPSLALTFGKECPGKTTSAEPANAAGQQSIKQINLSFSPAESTTAVFRKFSRTYTQEVVFARDIVAAHQEGFLKLTGLETPQRLAARVLEQLPPGKDSVEAFFDSRNHVSDCLAIDGPEFLIGEYLRSIRREQNELANAIVKRWWLRELAVTLQAAEYRAIVNLNCLSAPLWAENLASGPLFVDQLNAPDPKRQSVLSLALLTDLLHGDLNQRDNAVHINWHLNERDLASENKEKTAEVARLSLEKGPVTFVFDRPRRVVVLGEGMNRRHPAILMTVGLNLPCLAQKQGVFDNPTKFLDKLSSLARIAISAGIQKRDFLRRTGKDQPALIRGFALERARLLVVPIGLEHLVRTMTGESSCHEKGNRLARQIVERLQTILETEGHARRLSICLGSSLGQNFHFDDGNNDGPESPERVSPRFQEVTGVFPWDSEAPWKVQLKSALALHGIIGQGTAALVIPSHLNPTAEEAVEWLAWAWQNTDLSSLRMVRTAPIHKQLTLAIDSI